MVSIFLINIVDFCGLSIVSVSYKESSVFSGEFLSLQSPLKSIRSLQSPPESFRSLQPPTKTFSSIFHLIDSQNSLHLRKRHNFLHNQRKNRLEKTLLPSGKTSVYPDEVHPCAHIKPILHLQH